MRKRVLSVLLSAILCIELCAVFTAPASAAYSNNIRTILSLGSNGFAVKTDGTLWLWGINNTILMSISGDTSYDTYYPFPVEVLDGVKSVVNVATVILQDGTLRRFNQNWRNPTWDIIIGDVKEAGADWAIKTDNSLWVWENYAPPVKLMDNVKTASGQSNVAFMVVKQDGSLWARGSNLYGRLGDGTTEDRSEFVKIMDGVMDVSIISSAMILKEDGSLWVCGSNIDGVLGDGTITSWQAIGGQTTIVTDNDKHTPFKLMDGVKAIHLGGGKAFAIKDDDSLWGWGYNGGYSLGLPTINTAYPNPSMIMDGVADVSADSMNTLILKLDGSLWSVGENNRGQIGDGTQTIYGEGYFIIEDNTRKTPVKIMDGVMLPGGSSTTPTVPTPDSPSTWAADQIARAVSLNLVPQPLQSQYTQATTRAEFCALAVALYETATGRAITERMEFNDTTDVNVQKMGALNVVSGVGNGNFAPDDRLTREQAAAMLSRLADALGKPFPMQAPAFSDNVSISTWAFDVVGQVQAAGIMGGTGNNMFSPKDPYTREQSIVTILRLYDIVI